MEHDEFGLRTSRRIRVSDKRRETRALWRCWRRGQVRSRTREKSQASIATQHKGYTEEQASQQKQSGSGRAVAAEDGSGSGDAVGAELDAISKSCSDEVETKYDIDEAESQDHVGECDDRLGGLGNN